MRVVWVAVVATWAAGCARPAADGAVDATSGGWTTPGARGAAVDAPSTEPASSWPVGAVQAPRDPHVLDTAERLERLAGVTTWTGDLVIRHVTSLAPLASLQVVDGALTLEDCPGLTSLGGLDALTRVAGDLTLSDLPDLASLAPLGALDEIEDDLRLLDLPGVRTLGGLQGVSEVGGSVFLHDLPLLTSTAALHLPDPVVRVSVRDAPQLADLSMLADVTRTLGEVVVRDAGLAALTGMERIQSIRGSLVLDHLPQLTDLSALAALTTVDGDLRLQDDDALVVLTGLEGLRTIGRSLVLHDDDALFDLRALTDLAAAHDVEITDNAALDTVQGLDNLRDVPGIVRIQGNPALVRFYWARLGTVGTLHVENNAALRNLRRLGPPRSVGGLLLVENRLLTAFAWDGAQVRVDGWLFLRKNGLTSLGDVVFGGPFAGSLPGSQGAAVGIFDHSALADLSALSGLRTTPGRIAIASNHQLADLDGLANLTHAGVVDLYGNERLGDLGGLAALEDVDGRLSVSATPLLTGFDELASLTSVGQLELLNNEGVCADAVLALEARLGIVAVHDAPPCAP